MRLPSLRETYCFIEESASLKGEWEGLCTRHQGIVSFGGVAALILNVGIPTTRSLNRRLH